MSWVIDMVMPERKNRKLLFETAIQASNQIQNIYKLLREGEMQGIDFEKSVFTRIFEKDEKSPAICWIDEKQMIIRYPRFSTPYSHSFNGKCKFVECLSGILFDKNSNLKLFPGDKVKITPEQNAEPFTEDTICYLRVCIGDCNQEWDQVCAR